MPEIDPQILEEQRALLKKPLPAREFSPLKKCSRSGSEEDRERGLKLIQEGTMGCVILAGGQGTRLGYDGPKGCFPLGSTTLFEILAKRVPKNDLPVAIMTSRENDAATRAYWKEKKNFGLTNVSFFAQGDLPLLDEAGNPAGFGPDGNGALFKVFEPLRKKWEDQGVRAVNIILVDNALADPFDAELLGFHARTGAEVAIKCTERRNDSEKVGILVEEKGRIAVAEYFEVHAAGDYLANLGLFLVAMDFAKKMAKIDLPLHVAKKRGLYKFERFLFDMLPYAQRVEVLVYPRERCFAPLKNASGPDSPQEVVEKLKNM